MENLKDILLVFSSLTTLYLVFKYRKKDFQIALMKEQFNASREIYSKILQMTEELKEGYNKHVGYVRVTKHDITEEQIEHLQRWFFIEFGTRYTSCYASFRQQSLLLPSDSVELFNQYFIYVGNLFENRCEEDLNEEVNFTLDIKLAEIATTLNHTFRVDELTVTN